MGACASRFSVLKNADGTPPPAPAEEVASREVSVADVVVKKDDGAAAAEGDDEADRQSLGNLLTEVVEKALPTDDVKAASSVEIEASEKKTEEKPADEIIAKVEKIEDKPAEATTKIDKNDEDKKVEPVKTENPEATETKKTEEKKPEATETKKTEEKKPEATEMKTTEEKKPVVDGEKAKAGEDKTKK